LYLVIYTLQKREKEEWGRRRKQLSSTATQHPETPRREREGVRIPPEIPESRTSNPDHGIFDFFGEGFFGNKCVM
jgi:hypothetical protein